MVRTRDTDKITFRKSCVIRLTYKHDLGKPYNPSTRKSKAPTLQPFVGGKKPRRTVPQLYLLLLGPVIACKVYALVETNRGESHDYRRK